MMQVPYMKIKSIAVLLDEQLEMCQENALAKMHLDSEMPLSTAVLPLQAPAILVLPYHLRFLGQQ